MTRKEINKRLSRGIQCPICGMEMMDLAHDGYNHRDPDYHDYFCTECNLDFTITNEND